MADAPDPSATKTDPLRVLVLQGGGALGAYQAGAFEALWERKFEPEWVAGISIGAINAALIAGNAPQDRLDRLKTFWDTVTSPTPWHDFAFNDFTRAFFNEASSAAVAAYGVPGFFSPRFPPMLVCPSDDPTLLSYYDTSELRGTLQKLVDFDRINHRTAMRFSVGAVNVATGDMPYFENRTHTIAPEHIMASAALPPGFPAVRVENGYYWDGGVASNTPLDWVLQLQDDRNLLIFQIDLFSANGPLPRTMMEIDGREKEIRYSSRSRQSVAENRSVKNKRAAALRDLLARLPDNLRNDPAVLTLREDDREPTVTVIQLIYRSLNTESGSKDYNFAGSAMEEHWATGQRDVATAFSQPGWMDSPPAGQTMVVHRLKTSEPNFDQRK